MSQIGNCFEDALRFLLTHPDWILVHGVPLGTGGSANGLRYGHAWLEDGDTVYDPSIDQTFHKSIYYDIGNIELTAKYDFYEAKAAVQATKQCGPWDKKIWDKIDHRLK